MIRFDDVLAEQFARRTLAHVNRRWPYHMSHLWLGPDACGSPQEQHPIFFGSFDWHSCAHSWWQLLTLARLFPAMPVRSEIAELAEKTFTSAKVSRELAYFQHRGSAGFERPYGWGWLLALHQEALRHPGAGWGGMLEPLARHIADRLRAFLPLLAYPVRHGVHSNTAFALTLCLSWARAHDPQLADLIVARASDWFATDRDVRPLEPSGEDFLPPTLCEAQLMLAVLGRDAFASWFAEFLSTIPEALTLPVSVTDRSDGRLAHLDGLNLSRSWAWRQIGRALSNASFERLAEAHLAAALPHLEDDYMGEHWLTTFAVLALTSHV